MRRVTFILLVFLSLTVITSATTCAQEQDGYAPAEDVNLYYRVLGEGRPLLLINGGPGWSSDHMTPVGQRLATSYQVILFDQRGTGKSELAVLDSTTVTMQAMVDDIEALRRHLGIETWVVMGHSFGGMLAMAYAAAYADPVEALVLSAPAGATLDFTQYYQASLNDRLLPYEREAVAFWSDPDRMAAAPKKATYELMRASVGAFLYDRSRLDDILAILDEDTWSMPTSNLVWADLTRIDFDVRESLHSFDKPVLVVQGRQDALGDLHAYQTAHLFPDAKLHIIEESAHIMWLDQPAQYYDTVLGFLDQIP